MASNRPMVLTNASERCFGRKQIPPSRTSSGSVWLDPTMAPTPVVPSKRRYDWTPRLGRERGSPAGHLSFGGEKWVSHGVSTQWSNRWKRMILQRDWTWRQSGHGSDAINQAKDPIWFFGRRKFTIPDGLLAWLGWVRLTTHLRIWGLEL